MKKLPISAVIITRDEESNISRCLSSLRFCDELIVIDSGSTDKTVEVARTFTPIVRQRDWTGYSDQKTFANSLAKNDWILSVDADEEVSSELETELSLLVNKGLQDTAYSIPRRTYHFGKWIRFGGWYPNRLVRFFDRTKGNWEEKDVHEFWHARGSVGIIRQPLNHYSFKSLSDQVIRNDNYSTLGATHLLKAGGRSSLLKLVTKPASKFIETYLVKLGFLDGYPGFLISVSAAYSVFLKWAKLWELQHVTQQD